MKQRELNYLDAERRCETADLIASARAQETNDNLMPDGRPLWTPGELLILLPKRLGEVKRAA